jgi:flagellin-like hook-associated protein FlgL
MSSSGQYQTALGGCLNTTNKSTTQDTSKNKPDPVSTKSRDSSGPVNPLVGAYETIGKDKDKNKMKNDTIDNNTYDKEPFGSLEGRDLSLVQEDSKKMKSVLDKIKANPEIVDSLKTLNGIDINELNKLINNLNTVVDSFNAM